MTDTETLDAALAERKAAARELEENAERARVLGSTIEDLRVDLHRTEARRAAFAAHGHGHVEIPIKQFVPKYHSEIEFEPFRSIKTGKELAAVVTEKIKYLRARIAEHEQEIARLLAPGETR